MAWVVLTNRPVGSLLSSGFVNQMIADIADLDSRGRPVASTTATQETTTAAGYGNLATTGPSVPIVTGTAALIVLAAYVESPNQSQSSFMGFAVSGATTIAASDAQAISSKSNNTSSIGVQMGAVFSDVALTAGANTFTAQYRSQGGTATFANRTIIVWPASNLS